MAVETLTGSCHCGHVRFEVDLDLDQATGKCNCSVCTKLRHWGAMVKPEAFRLLSEPGATRDYQFGTHSAHWPFCTNCGAHAYGFGDIPGLGPYVSVNVACLDDIAPERLAALQVRFADGRANAWHQAPAVTAHL